MKGRILKLVDMASHLVLLSFMMVILVVAVASSLLRHYAPNINDYRTYFLEQINANDKGLVIDAKEIRSEWNLFRPEISLYGVSIKSNKLDENLHLDILDVKLNVMRSILTQTLYFDYIELSNLDVLLIEDENRQWSFANLKSGNTERQSISQVLNRFWDVDELVLQNIHLSLQPYQHEKISLPDVNARLSTYRSRKHITIALTQHGQYLGSLLVKTKHEPTAKNFVLQAYLDLSHYDLSVLSGLLPANLALVNGGISNKSWIYWKEGKLTFNSSLDIDKFSFKRNESIWNLKHLGGKVYGTYDNHNLVLEWPELDIGAEKSQIKLGHVKFTFGDIFRMQMASVDLAELTTFIQHFPLSGKLQEVLATLHPTGHLNKLSMFSGQDRPFSLRAELKNVSVGAWKGAPELKSVNGFLYVDKQGGYVEFDTTDFSMYFPHIYKKPMLFDQASGYVDWHIGEKTVYVSGEKLHLKGISGEAHGEFAVSLPRIKSDDNSPRLSLNIGMKNSAAQYRDIFIPYTISSDLLQWLENNIHEGKVPEVAFIYHGPIHNNTPEKKTIQLWLKVDGASLGFADKWPLIKDISGEFLLDDHYGFARIDKADTSGVSINQASFRLFPEKGGNAIEVVAQTNASSSDAFHYLKNEGLQEKTGSVFSDWRAGNGSVNATVKVNTLLEEKGVTNHVVVDASLLSSDLEIPGYNINIKNISGDLHYDTSTGFSSPAFSAVLFENPLVGSIETLGKNKGKETFIHVSGDVSVKDLIRWSEQPALGFLKGSSKVKADIYYGDAGAGINFNTNLAGVAVDLPKPFGKTSDVEQALQINVPFSGKKREISVAYGKGINASFMEGAKGIDAGVINLGLNKATYQKGKIVLGGQIIDVSVDEWLDVINRFEHFNAKSDPAIRKKNSSLIFTVEKLKIKNLKGYDQSLDSVSLDLFNTGSYWQIGIDHSDLQATLKIYDDENKPLDLHLLRVNLDFLNKKQKESGVSYASSSWSKFPDMDVVIDKLISGGEDFGEWEFNLRSYDDRVALENLQASVKALRITETFTEPATLWWTLGDKPQSHFKGMFLSDNIANVLKAWGYKQEVRSKKAEFVVNCWWDGVPTDFDFNKMNARVQMKLEKGNFADVSSSGTDALKVVGIFNIANLLKRLKLDFSDLTNTGLSYETVGGLVSIHDGIYHYDKPIEIKSSASKIRLYGGFDMNTRQLDMTMGVTLPLASNLPWIVALAAGLPAAAGVYIISKVMNKQVDQISSAVYKVTGDFADPQIKFDSLFDNEAAYEKKHPIQPVEDSSSDKQQPDDKMTGDEKVPLKPLP